MLPATEVNLHVAAQHLLTGPVGVGEDHTNPQGRLFVLHLLQMRARPVENLFVEVRDWGNSLITDAVRRFRGGGNQGEVESTLAGIPEQYSCYVTLRTVIAFAIRRGVWVYCVDGGGRAVTARNSFISAQFRRKTNNYGRTARSLLLIGGDHFDGATPNLQTLIPELLYLRFG